MAMGTKDYGPGPNGRSGRDEVAVAFSAFVLSHAGCGEDLIESRMDERRVACWCLRCDDARTFGATDTEFG